MKKFNEILILILCLFGIRFFFSRYAELGCFKETFFLVKSGTCYEEFAEKNGFGKTAHKKWESDAKLGLIQENYSINTISATDITSNSVVLNGDVVNSKNNIPPTGSNYFFYGYSREEMNFISDSYPFQQNGEYSIRLKGLEPHTTYFFVAAIDFINEAPSPEDIKKSDKILSFTTL